MTARSDRPVRRQSFMARATRRNREIAARNARVVASLPLFAHAGLLDQVAQLDERHWDALAVAYNDIEVGMLTYLREREQEREHERQYAAYCAMLDEAVGVAQREQIEAAYAARWSASYARSSMMSWPYRLQHLCTCLSQHTGRTPVEVFEEARRRAAAGALP